MNLEFFVRDKRLTRKGREPLVGDTAGYYTFTIDFDEEWEGLAILVVFRNGSDSVQMLYRGQMNLPAKVSGRGDLYVACHGYRKLGDSVAVVRTIRMSHPVRLLGSEPMAGDASGEYTPTVFEQVMAAAAKAETAAANLLELRDSGALTGPAGPRGLPGENGGYYTPAVIQVNGTTMQVRFSASKAGMPDVEAVDVTLPAGLQDEKGEEGNFGNRGTGIILIKSTPTAYKEETNGLTPAYRTTRALVIDHSGMDPIVGDIIQWSYYQYPVISVDDTYVYMSDRFSIRGATGATPVKGVDYWTPEEQAEVANATNAANNASAAANTAADEANAAASEVRRAVAAGEFDGTSVTVSSVTESSEDGGNNVVKFSDGKTLNVKNGRPAGLYRRIWYTDIRGEGGAAGELLLFEQMSGAVEPTLSTVKEYDILISRADNSLMYVTSVDDGSWFADKKPRAGIGPVMGYVEGLSGGEGETIESIERTSGDGSPGTTDTYTITTTSGKTTEFTIYNGKDGKDGEDGVSPTVTLGHFAEGLRRGVRIMFTDADGKKDPVDIWDGYTPNLTIGTVETLPAGSEATADLTTADGINYNLNFGIPKGTGTADMVTLTVGFDSKCDYVCDGTADEEQINAALAALPDDGGLVLLKSGTYNLTGSINETAKKNNVELRGDYAGKVHLVRDRANTTTSFSAQFNICSKHQVLRNLSVENDGTGSFEDGYVFNILAGVESVLFDQCVFSGHRYGIRTVVGMGAKSSSATVRNCVFESNWVGAYLQEIGGVEACQFRNNNTGVKIDLSNDLGYVRDSVFTDNDIGIQDCGDGTQITGNVITRGGGTAADYTADQHTILMGMTDTSGAKYGTGNVVAFNQLRGKDVSFQTAEPASDAYAAAKESTVIIPFEAGGGGSSDSSLLMTKPGSTITYLKDVPLTFADNQAIIGQSLPIKEGQVCTVVCDGTAYETVARSVVYEGMPALALGNLTFMGGEDTGEPFLLGTIEAMGMTMIILLGNGEHTFTVYSTEPGKDVIDHEQYLDFGWYPTVTTADEILLEDTTLGVLKGQKDNLGFSLPAVGSVLTVTINGTPYEYPVLTCGLYKQVFGSEMARTAGGVFNGNGLAVGAPVVFAQAVSQATCTFTLVDTSLGDDATISVSAKSLKYNPIPKAFLEDSAPGVTVHLNGSHSTDRDALKAMQTALSEGKFAACTVAGVGGSYRVLALDYDWVDDFSKLLLVDYAGVYLATYQGGFKFEALASSRGLTLMHESGIALGTPFYMKVKENGTPYLKDSTGKTVWDGAPESVDGIVVNSSTEGSTKKFRITVDDSGTLSATEVV